MQAQMLHGPMQQRRSMRCLKSLDGLSSRSQDSFAMLGNVTTPLFSSQLASLHLIGYSYHYGYLMDRAGSLANGQLLTQWIRPESVAPPMLLAHAADSVTDI